MVIFRRLLVNGDCLVLVAPVEAHGIVVYLTAEHESSADSVVEFVSEHGTLHSFFTFFTFDKWLPDLVIVGTWHAIFSVLFPRVLFRLCETDVAAVDYHYQHNECC